MVQQNASPFALMSRKRVNSIVQPMNKPFASLSQSQRATLEYIRGRGDISRVEIARLTGLTPGALSRVVRDLINMKLVQEGDRLPSRRGQPPLSLRLNKDAIWSIGVSFSLHEIEVVAIDFAGSIIEIVRTELSDRTAAEVLDDCTRMIDEVIEKQCGNGRSDAVKRLLGIGFALPGYFRADSPQKVESVSNLEILSKVNLAGLSAMFGHDTWFENNSTAAALAEYYHRSNRDTKSLAVINIGYGFSAGYVVSGKLYRGRQGNAGEIGRIYPRGAPRPSVVDLENTLRQEQIEISSTQELAALCKDPPQCLTAWLARAGEQLGHVIEMMDFILAPEDIVIGGQIPPELVKLLFQNIKATKVRGTNLSLRPSKLAPQVAAHGAAFLPIYHNFSADS